MSDVYKPLSREYHCYCCDHSWTAPVNSMAPPSDEISCPECSSTETAQHPAFLFVNSLMPAWTKAATQAFGWFDPEVAVNMAWELPSDMSIANVLLATHLFIAERSPYTKDYWQTGESYFLDEIYTEIDRFTKGGETAVSPISFTIMPHWEGSSAGRGWTDPIVTVLMARVIQKHVWKEIVGDSDDLNVDSRGVQDLVYQATDRFIALHEPENPLYWKGESFGQATAMIKPVYDFCKVVRSRIDLKSFVDGSHSCDWSGALQDFTRTVRSDKPIAEGVLGASFAKAELRVCAQMADELKDSVAQIAGEAIYGMVEYILDNEQEDFIRQLCEEQSIELIDGASTEPVHDFEHGNGSLFEVMKIVKAGTHPFVDAWSVKAALDKLVLSQAPAKFKAKFCSEVLQAVTEAKYCKEDWQYEVQSGDTKLGYSAWIRSCVERDKEDVYA